MAEDDKERLFKIVEESVRADSELKARIEALEVRLENLEHTVEDRISTLEGEMGTMNAHLDNIARESSIANEIARQRAKAEKEEREEKERLAREAQEAEEARQKDKLEMIKRAGKSVWEVLKLPLSTLLTGIVAWLLYSYFYVPDETPDPPQIEQSAEEGVEEDATP